MTNNEIILQHSVELAKQGIIKWSNVPCKYKNEEGKEIDGFLPEQIHTYAAWKALGFQVKRGEKAKAKFEIWKCSVKKVEAKGKDLRTGEIVTEEVDSKRMFRKLSFWFTQDQVEAIA